MTHNKHSKPANLTVENGRSMLNAESRSAIRSRNIAQYYSVELSDKKASRKILENSSPNDLHKKYAGYDL